LLKINGIAVVVLRGGQASRDRRSSAILISVNALAASCRAGMFRPGTCQGRILAA
jgi:hypothetical protein